MSNDQVVSFSAFMESLCERGREGFYKAYGKPQNSLARNVPLLATDRWELIMTASYASEVFLVNTDAANTIEFAVDDQWTAGGVIVAGDGRALRDFRGNLFARSLDSTKTSSVNVVALGLWE